MNVLIAVPTYENICPEVFKAIYYIDKGKHQVDFDFVKGYDTATARNNIAIEAMNKGYDYVLMIDNDTIVPKEALLNMLEPQKDVVIGFCPMKNTTTKDSALWRSKSSLKPIRLNEMPHQPRIEIELGGMACALIKTDVFKRIPFPWFYFEQRRDGLHTSEGYYFCDKARENGYQIWADTRVKCGHLVRRFQYE
jgi:GT2 family glycosyltransferase